MRTLATARHLFVASSCLLLLACGSTEVSQSDGLPAVELIELDSGDVVELDGLDGPAVINLWATWCAPCRAEMPDFETVHQDLGDSVRFVGISIDVETGGLDEFIAEVGVTYRQLVDTTSAVPNAFEARTMPSTIFVDATGRVTEVHAGALDEAGLRAKVRELL